MRAKTFFILSFLFAFGHACCGQSFSGQTDHNLYVSELLEQLETVPQRGSDLTFAEQPGRKQLFLRMPFDEATFETPEDWQQVTGIIERIDLVYTDYQEDESFDQNSLNARRIEALLQLEPLLPRLTRIKWGAIALTGIPNEKEARKQFHGFIIRYRPSSDRDQRMQEATFLSQVGNLNSESIFPSMVFPEGVTPSPLPDKVTPRIGYIIRHTVTDAGDTLTRDTIGLAPDLREFPSAVRNSAAQTPKKNTDVRKAAQPQFDDDTEVCSSAQQHLRRMKMGVQLVLDRHPEWKGMLQVCDVTTSMSPYSAQLLLWLKESQNRERVGLITFTNDGDRKSESEKQVGSTGGLYHTRTSDFNSIITTCTGAVLQCDDQTEDENYVEAILAGLKLYPSAKEVILLADNYANIRDLELVKKLKKPVRIILCGDDHFLNTDLLSLARQTKGSVHTATEDFTDLHLLPENEDVQIGEQRFFILDHKFHLSLDFPSDQ